MVRVWSQFRSQCVISEGIYTKQDTTVAEILPHMLPTPFPTPKPARSRTWKKWLITNWDHTDIISTGWRTQPLSAYCLSRRPIYKWEDFKRHKSDVLDCVSAFPLELKYGNPTLWWNVLGRRWSLWEVIRLRWGHEGGSVSHFLVMRGYREKAGICKPRRGPFPELAHAGTLI